MRGKRISLDQNHHDSCIDRNFVKEVEMGRIILSCFRPMILSSRCHRWAVVFIKLSGFSWTQKGDGFFLFFQSIDGFDSVEHKIWGIVFVNARLQWTFGLASMYNFLFKLSSQLLRHHPDGNLHQNFSLVYDDDATNKFKIFLLIIILCCFVVEWSVGLDTADNEKHKVIFYPNSNNHQFPPFTSKFFV